ncbi:MAG: hypothetical protein ACRDP6_36090, partial [Actinoallomurus sp.]
MGRRPYIEDSFTINTGDLPTHRTGDRSRSNRHRALPPDPSAPDEDLVYLIYLYAPDRRAASDCTAASDRRA